MEGTPAMYLGRIVDKKNFRAFIYSPNGQQRLAESWEEFEANMQSGLWFATRENAESSKALGDEYEQPMPSKKPRKLKAKPVLVEEIKDVGDASVFEVTDDFLPKKGE